MNNSSINIFTTSNSTTETTTTSSKFKKNTIYNKLYYHQKQQQPRDRHRRSKYFSKNHLHQQQPPPPPSPSPPPAPTLHQSSYNKNDIIQKSQYSRHNYDGRHYPQYLQNISVKTAMTVLAVALIQLTTANKLEFTCTSEDDFFYAVPGSRCTSYYKCQRGIKFNHECFPGAIFDFYKQTCTRTAGICYEPVCTGRADGTFQDTTHACRRSFSCRGGNLIKIDNCPYGQLHNGHNCVLQEFVVCDLPQTTAIAYPYAGDKRCKGLKNGNHLATDDFSSCNRYIFCRNEEVIDDLECPRKQKFHQALEQCVNEREVTNCKAIDSVNICKGLSNGYHSDPSSIDCKNYVKCFNENVLSMEYCGSQAVFNGISCVPLPLYQCPGLIHLPTFDICKRKPNGFISDPMKGCSAYVKCYGERTFEYFHCPIGQYFDPDIQNCVYEKFSENRKCKNIEPSNECTQLEAGYYQDKSRESSCRNYYFCYNGNRTNFQCGYGKVYDGENCVNAQSYVCPNLDPNSCVSKLDGYYRDLQGGCRSYYYCSNGQKYTYLCGEQQLFNGHSCVQRKTTEDHQICNNLNICNGKLDGYYQDYTSNCRNYYFCLKGEMITTITCRGNRIFNGHKCVSPDSYLCSLKYHNDVNININLNHNQNQNKAITINPTEKLFNCMPRLCQQQIDDGCQRNGFFIDYDSKCINYYFCIGNKKTLLSCTDGFVFNGEICVPHNQYNCPRYCTDHCT